MRKLHIWQAAAVDVAEEGFASSDLLGLPKLFHWVCTGFVCCNVCNVCSSSDIQGLCFRVSASAIHLGNARSLAPASQLVGFLQTWDSCVSGFCLSCRRLIALVITINKNHLPL